MRKLYGDVYKCGMSHRPRRVGGKRLEKDMFRHQLKPFKIGVMVKRKWQLDDKIRWLLKKYAVVKKPSLIIQADGKRIFSKGGGVTSGKDGPSED